MANENDKSRPIVVAGPSGVGKSTLITRLRSKYPNSFGFSVSHTTRTPRPSEEHGVHYHFVSDEEFEAIKEQGGFVEHAQFAANKYGTSKTALERVRSSGQVCLLDIDLQGVRQIKSLSDPDLVPHFVFLTPPSVDELRRRLVGRGDTASDAIEKRISRAIEEIAAVESEPHLFDAVIVSDDPDKTYEEFERVIIAANPNFNHT